MNLIDEINIHLLESGKLYYEFFRNENEIINDENDCLIFEKTYNSMDSSDKNRIKFPHGTPLFFIKKKNNYLEFLVLDKVVWAPLAWYKANEQYGYFFIEAKKPCNYYTFFTLKELLKLD